MDAAPGTSSGTQNNGSSDDDLEADKPENDVLYEVSSSDEDISSESEDESDEEAPAPPRDDRTCPVPKRARLGDEWNRSNTPPIVDNFTATPGLTIPLPATPLQFLQLFFTRAVVEYLEYETNLHATHVIHLMAESARKTWKPVSVKEMARYLALCILMGIVKMPTMRMYWQTNQMWHCRFFNLFMSSARFQHISKFFHMFTHVAHLDYNVAPPRICNKL
ncbi:piggyBac transposable element-derived protein 5-like [Procambarus clarkii]|uniref:piggyBac transposable element-derived protein 5-like n=1 Tax=Procambarus clarkii TaxID=6728 RepID=UPI003743DB30